MKIAVCIKQVPSAETKMNWETGTLVRDPARMDINSFDRFAVETALRLKDDLGGEVTAFTMGPPSAEKVLRTVFAYGVDKGFLITDKAFAGADVLATSYTLSQAIRSVGSFDIIICGQQTTDGDTAQVPPSLATWMGYPFASWVRSVEYADKQNIQVMVTGTQSIYKLELSLPCLISVEENSCEVRVPTIQGKIAARKKEISTITLESLADKNKDNYGLKSSPTRVVKMYTPALKAKVQPEEKMPSEILEIIRSEAGGVING